MLYRLRARPRCSQRPAFVLLTGRLAPKVVLGRDWPASERISLDRIGHEAWDGLLQRYVDSAGGVDYANWKTSSRHVAELDEYLAQLSRADHGSARAASGAARVLDQRL